MTITAKIIQDSVSFEGIRLTTMELQYPRFIHAEFMTHRVFSRNASSSRAIPVKRMVLDVIQDTASPLHWGKNQPGMQAEDTIENDEEAAEIWHRAGIDAVFHAEELNNLGVHKQIVNRIIEPFAHIRVIVTATEWDNFFALRLHKDAQPEIQALACSMREAMDNSDPLLVDIGEWHKPYAKHDEPLGASVARCARVSYNNHDGSSPDLDKDKMLAAKLATSGHWSPFEHQATPIQSKEDATHMDSKGTLWSANFRGWIQYRQIL